MICKEATPEQIAAMLSQIRIVPVKRPTRKELLARVKRHMRIAVREGWLTRYKAEKVVRLFKAGYNIAEEWTDDVDQPTRAIVATHEIRIEYRAIKPKPKRRRKR